MKTATSMHKNLKDNLLILLMPGSTGKAKTLKLSQNRRFRHSNPTVGTPNPTVGAINPTVETTNPMVETINPTVRTTNPKVATTNPKDKITKQQFIN